MLVEVLMQGDNLLSIAVDIPFAQSQQFASFATPKLGRFKPQARWHFNKVDGDRVCLTAVNMIKPWQKEFLDKLGEVANDYKRSAGL